MVSVDSNQCKEDKLEDVAFKNSVGKSWRLSLGNPNGLDSVAECGKTSEGSQGRKDADDVVNSPLLLADWAVVVLWVWVWMWVWMWMLILLLVSLPPGTSWVRWVWTWMWTWVGSWVWLPSVQKSLGDVSGIEVCMNRMEEGKTSNGNQDPSGDPDSLAPLLQFRSAWLDDRHWLRNSLRLLHVVVDDNVWLDEPLIVSTFNPWVLALIHY